MQQEANTPQVQDNNFWKDVNRVLIEVFDGADNTLKRQLHICLERAINSGVEPFADDNGKAILLFFNDQVQLLCDALYTYFNRMKDAAEWRGLRLKLKTLNRVDVIDIYSVIRDFCRRFTCDQAFWHLRNWQLVTLHDPKNVADGLDEDAVLLIFRKVEVMVGISFSWPKDISDNPDLSCKANCGQKNKFTTSKLDFKQVLHRLTTPSPLPLTYAKQVASYIFDLLNPEKIYLVNQIGWRTLQDQVYYTMDLLVILPSYTMESTEAYRSMIRDQFLPMGSVLVHFESISRINSLLRESHMLYSYVCTPENLLYEKDELPLSVSNPPDLPRLFRRARRVLAIGQARATPFLDGALYFRKHKEYAIATFMLAQATILLMTGFLQATMGQNYFSTDLYQLLRKSYRVCPDFYDLFPADTETNIHLTTVLANAYTNSRYSNEFVITIQELDILITKVTDIFDVASRVIESRINTLKISIDQNQK